jgi:hypothetical protein
MKYANRTYKVIIIPNVVEYCKTEHGEDWESSWGGHTIEHSGGSRNVKYEKREGTKISLHPISNYRKKMKK